MFVDHFQSFLKHLFFRDVLYIGQFFDNGVQRVVQKTFGQLAQQLVGNALLVFSGKQIAHINNGAGNASDPTITSRDRLAWPIIYRYRDVRSRCSPRQVFDHFLQLFVEKIKSGLGLVLVFRRHVGATSCAPFADAFSAISYRVQCGRARTRQDAALRLSRSTTTTTTTP